LEFPAPLCLTLCVSDPFAPRPPSLFPRDGKVFVRPEQTARFPSQPFFSLLNFRSRALNARPWFFSAERPLPDRQPSLRTVLLLGPSTSVHAGDFFCAPRCRAFGWGALCVLDRGAFSYSTGRAFRRSAGHDAFPFAVLHRTFFFSNGCLAVFLSSDRLFSNPEARSPFQAAAHAVFALRDFLFPPAALSHLFPSYRFE